MKSEKPFTFEISLSVLNHLGRSLYRSFATVLGEAISNSWDADAKSVHVSIDRRRNSFIIKDDGDGMTSDDFQNKFLKIGYSKRKEEGTNLSPAGRPFIGRKGIGKLALLSCADKISVISKASGGKYIGGTIDNSALDKAIKRDLTPDQYELGNWRSATFAKYTTAHSHGTIILFEGLKHGIKGSFPFLAKIIALYFRFSLLDPSFNIYLNGEKITHKHLKPLAEKTEFLWEIGDYEDAYVDALKLRFSKNPEDHEKGQAKMGAINGFIASVEKPRHLKILTTDENVGIDLFVNGRLRERDILKRIPTERIAESYLYGQIHFNALDDSEDRFTTSREGIVADDPKYKKFLEAFRKTILKIVEYWDKWRINHREEGDSDNERLSRTQRASLGLYGAVSNQYDLPKASKSRARVTGWVADLSRDATFNFESYADCFVSENLIRRYIKEKRVTLSPKAKAAAKVWKDREKTSKGKGNISIPIRRESTTASYLSMEDLANEVDKRDAAREACLARDANEYKPMRDAVAHTALLTDLAKKKLETVRENIKARVKTILSKPK
ncbi:MAG TPA: ATP-binding protein [Candidatus Acidoferrales bacterium]|nr:ATP-binding protein [Candidatus Acidoferrales bacterium]